MKRETNLIYMDFIDITDSYLGDLIEDVVSRFYRQLNLSDEYGELLEFISSKLVEGLFGKNITPDPSAYENKLKRLLGKNNRTKLMNVISYLVSQYIAFKEEEDQDFE